MKIFLFLCLTLLCLNGNNYAQEMEDFTWLLGTWQAEQEDITMLEEWYQENDSTFTGTGKMVRNGEILFAETLTFQYRNSTYEYLAVLPSKTARFELNKADSSSISFLDAKNDFPSLITYSKLGSGIKVLLEGYENEIQKKETITFKKK